jgi:hypothetical protein
MLSVSASGIGQSGSTARPLPVDARQHEAFVRIELLLRSATAVRRILGTLPSGIRWRFAFLRVDHRQAAPSWPTVDPVG